MKILKSVSSYSVYCLTDQGLVVLELLSQLKSKYYSYPDLLLWVELEIITGLITVANNDLAPLTSSSQSAYKYNKCLQCVITI